MSMRYLRRSLALACCFTLLIAAVATPQGRGRRGRGADLPLEAARTISFTFRLFGNMCAGVVFLVAMAFFFPLIGIIQFIGLELFVGLIQAFIFAMLTLVFAASATIAHGGDDH